MNNEKGCGMQKKHDDEKANAPSLRFPAFASREGWQPTEIGPYLREYSERVPSSTELSVYSSTRSGLQPQKDYYDDRELANDGEYGVVPDNYFVYRHMSDDGTFKFNINKIGKKIAVSKEYPVFSTEGIEPEFLQYLLNEGSAFKRFALAQKKGGTRTRLYFGTLCTFSAPLPRRDEQLSIASCLLSLDDSISSASKKLEALKTHKRGLMQKLFPRERKTFPQLRFREFMEAGNWKRKKISELLARTINPVDVDGGEIYREIGIRSHGKGLFHKDPISGKALGEKRVFWVKEDVLIVNIVFAWEQAVAVTSAAEKGMIASHRFPMYAPQDQKANVDFINYFFLTKKGKELLGVASPGGAGRNKTLNQNDFENMEFLCPEHVDEQARIARCLSSIDDLIAAESQKIDHLETYKRGLMQRLFPVMKEAHS